MVEGENDESHGAHALRWHQSSQEPAKSHPHGTYPVFMAQVIGGAGGGHVNYALIGNFTKAEINARLQAGQELYEFINGFPTRLTIMQGGGAKSRRKRKTRLGKKTKRYSIFTK
jgi:hypothetical protein